MKLNRRYRRSIKSDLSFYIPAIILTMVTLVMFYLFYIAGTGIMNYGDSFFAEHNVEDATFTTYLPISDADIEKLEQDYNLKIEAERYVNFQEDGYTARVFKRLAEIDQYEIIEGNDVAADDEIILSAGYAENQKLAIGDTVLINGKNYRITGFFLRPDYLYMLENTSDDYKNVTSFFLAYVSDNEFDQFGEYAVNYKVLYNADSDVKAFRQYVYDHYYTASYLAKEENTRITFVDEQAEMFVLMAWVMLVILPFITVALISIIIGRKIKSEQKIIGTLSALGYTKGQLMKHYCLLPVIPGLIGGILSAVAAMLVAQPYGECGLADYEPLPATFSLPLWTAIAGVIVPTVIYLFAGLLKVNKLLKNDTVQLLGGIVGNNGRTNRIFYKASMKVKNKMAFRSLLGAPGRTFVLFLGIFLGAFIIAFGYIFIDCINEVGANGMNSFGTFQYEYVLNTLKSDSEKMDGEYEVMSVYSFEDQNGLEFSLMGADADNTLWNLQTKEGKADIENGWYASSLFLRMFHVNVGDEFTFYNTSSLEKFTVMIAGVIDNDYQNYLISSRERAARITGWNEDSYNVLLSTDKLNLDFNLIHETVTGDTFKEQMQTMLDEMGPLTYVLILLGMIICAAAIFVVVSMMVSESRHNISMLKVLGFKDSRINSMIINGNHLMLIPGIVIGLLASYGTMYAYCQLAIESEGMIIPVPFSWKTTLLTVVLVVAAYAVSLFAARLRVSKVDMVESLKDNRE